MPLTATEWVDEGPGAFFRYDDTSVHWDDPAIFWDGTTTVWIDEDDTP